MFIDRFMDYIADMSPDMCNKLGYYPAIKTVLQEAVVFQVDDVSEYYWRNARNDWHQRDDFPNVAPVYPTMWLEWHIPREVCIEGKWHENPSSPATYGYLLKSFSEINEVYGSLAYVIKTAKLEQITSPPPYKLKWVSTGMQFIEDKVHHYAQMTHVQHWWVEDDGQRWLPQMVNGDYLYPTIFSSSKAGQTYKNWATAGKIDHGEAFNIPSFALCFLHCKNTIVHTHEPDVPLQKARESRGRLPLVKYHTLEIKPMAKILKEQGCSETKGLKYALHICRGHFKDFSRGNGLFGRHKGLYWWDSQVRGAMTEGITLKDYSVSRQ